MWIQSVSITAYSLHPWKWRNVYISALQQHQRGSWIQHKQGFIMTSLWGSLLTGLGESTHAGSVMDRKWNWLHVFKTPCSFFSLSRIFTLTRRVQTGRGTVMKMDFLSYRSAHTCSTVSSRTIWIFTWPALHGTKLTSCLHLNSIHLFLSKTWCTVPRKEYDCQMWNLTMRR